MDTQSRYIRLRREDIAYFKFIIESYEGMAVVRTQDPREAIVELMIAPGWEKDVDEVLEGLQKEIPIECLRNSKQFQNLNFKTQRFLLFGSFQHLEFVPVSNFGFALRIYNYEGLLSSEDSRSFSSFTLDILRPTISTIHILFPSRAIISPT